MDKIIKTDQKLNNSNLPQLLNSTNKTLSIKDVVYSEEKSISTLLKNGQDNEVRAMLTYCISNLCLSINVGKQMNVHQIVDCVNLIMSQDEFKHLKPLDFKLAFERSLTGRYGKIYDRIDVMIIFDMLRYYDQEREQEIISYNKIKSLEYVEQNQKDISERTSLQPIIDELKKNIDEKKENLKKSLLENKQPKTMKVQKWMIFFNWLFDRQNLINSGSRFVKIGQKMMSIDEFLTFRIEKYNNRGF